MPNLIERRRMKRRQMGAIQSPVYNIYYTESVPIQRMPIFAHNHTQSFPQLNQSMHSNLGPQRPSLSGQNIRNENDNKVYGVPIFPEEEQTRYSSIQYHNQSLRTDEPGFVNRQQSLPQNLCSYGPDFQTNNPALSGTYQSHGRANISNQHITLPAQPDSTEGYSMKIEVLATPLKGGDPSSKNTLAEKRAGSCEDNSHFLRIDDSMRPRKNHTFVEPAKQILYPSEDGKKRLSLLSKIRRKMNGKKSQSVVDENDYHYRANSAQEILSPRQLLESTTNVCSSIQSSEIPAPSNNEATDISHVTAATFQEALKNLEDTLKRTEDVEIPSAIKMPDSHSASSAMSFLCQSCKLKSDNDAVDHSRMTGIQESRGSTSSHSRVCRANSCKLWQSSYTSKSWQANLDDLHHNTRQHRFRFNDHSPPERDLPSQLRQCTDSLKGNRRPEPPAGSCSPARCGLVMYGQKHAISQYDRYYH